MSPRGSSVVHRPLAGDRKHPEREWQVARDLERRAALLPSQVLDALQARKRDRRLVEQVVAEFLERDLLAVDLRRERLVEADAHLVRADGTRLRIPGLGAD